MQKRWRKIWKRKREESRIRNHKEREKDGENDVCRWEEKDSTGFLRREAFKEKKVKKRGKRRKGAREDMEGCMRVDVWRLENWRVLGAGEGVLGVEEGVLGGRGRGVGG